MVQHNHLDQRRRDRGQCEACDALWEAQDRRLAPVERELPKKVSPPPGDLIPAGGWTRVHGCAGMFVGRGGTWICNRERDHKGAHWCPLHEAEWSERKR